MTLYSPFTAALEKMRLLFQRRNGDALPAVLGDKDGPGGRVDIPDMNGFVYIRFPGTPDANGFATYSAPSPARSSNAAYANYPGAPVYVAYGYSGELEIVGANNRAFDQAGIDTRLFNPANQQSKWVYPWQITIGFASAVANSVTGSFLVTVKKYRHYVNNIFQTFETAAQADKVDLQPYIPATDMHRYAAVWVDTYANTAHVTISTVQSMFTTLDDTDIQECVTERPPDAIPHKLFYLANNQGSVTQQAAKDVDVRQFLNTPSILGLPNPVAYQERVQPDRALVYHGTLTVNASLTVLGKVSVLGDPAEGGGGSSGMTDFIVAADTGTPATIGDGDTLTAVGDGETTEVSLSGKTWTIATKPHAIPKICNLRIGVDGGNGADDMIAAFTNATALSFLPWSQGGTFSLPRSGIWNYYDIGDISGDIDYAKTGLTGNVTNTSTIITAIQNTEQLAVGMKVAGTGINAAATIATVDSASQISMSHAATATNTGVALTFTFPADVNYDVFLKYSTVESAVIPVYEKWSTNVIRTVMPLPLYDYVVVSDNNDDYRFLATIRAGASGFSKNDTDCHVSNWDNPYPHKMLYQDTTIYAYSTTTWRAWRNQSAARFSVVVQLFALMEFEFVIGTTTTSNQPLIGIDVDGSPVAQDGQAKGGYGSQTAVRLDARCSLTTTRSQGRHVITPIERGATGASFHGVFVPVSSNDVLAGFSGKVWS